MGCNQCFIDSAPELEVVITTYSFFAGLLVLFFVLLFVVTVSRPGGIPRCRFSGWWGVGFGGSSQ